jgi:hypothetical protein
MDALRTAFPDLMAEIVEALQRLGRIDLAEQLHDAFVSAVTFDNSANAGYIYLRAGRPLNTVEERVVGVRHGETICLETSHSINLDTDNFGRLTGIELLSAPGAWKGELRRRAAV